MLTHERLEDNIYYYKNIYDNPILFLEHVKNNVVWRDWVSSDGFSIYGKVSGGHIPLSSEILQVLKNSVNKCLYDYCLKTGSDFGWVPEFYTIQKYNVDAYMGPHVDSTDRTIKNMPTISIVIYLNDDYDGGEICFPNQKISIKPEAGSMIIFPSYEPYIHDPKPVTSGDKYMSPVFCFKEPF